MNRFYHLTSTIFFTCGSFTAVFGGEVLTVAKPLQSVSPVQKTAASVILVAQPIVTAQAQLKTPPDDDGVASPAELSTSAKENKTTAERLTQDKQKKFRAITTQAHSRPSVSYE